MKMGRKNHQHQAHGTDVTALVPLVKIKHNIDQRQAHGADVTKEIPLAKNEPQDSPAPGSRSQCS